MKYDRVTILSSREAKAYIGGAGFSIEVDSLSPSDEIPILAMAATWLRDGAIITNLSTFSELNPKELAGLNSEHGRK
tara:strand:- start:937 stop:1167 length:231 start_codon:yes stop_codon:yes gene_type:complete